MSEPVAAVYLNPSRRASSTADASRPAGRTASANRSFGLALRSTGRFERGGVASSNPLTHIVRRGENLCRDCENALRSTGADPSEREVYLAAQRVAKANGLRDADFILTGQTLDLSVLRVQGQPPRAVGGAAPNLKASSPSSARTAALLQRLAALTDRASRVSESAKTSSMVSGVVDGPTRLSSGFGMRRDPFTGRRQHHDGIDLAAAIGTNVYPAMAGTVTFSGWRSGYGRAVIVEHGNGIETRYAHNAKNHVRVGERVTTGTQIADVGSSGRSTGPHLHFEVRKNGRPIDPEPYLSRTPLQVAQAR